MSPIDTQSDRKQLGDKTNLTHSIMFAAISCVLMSGAMYLAIFHRDVSVMGHVSTMVLVGLAYQLLFNARLRSLLIFVCVMAISHTIVLGAGLFERQLWFSAPDKHSWISYDSHYDVNQHRYFLIRCEARGISPMLFVIEKNGKSYARCGELIPNSISLVAPTALFNKASSDATKVSPSTPILLSLPTKQESI